MSIPSFPIHRSGIPYTETAAPLQTLDIWLPRPLEESDGTKTIWLVFIHGGAWRDPLQTSLNYVLPTLQHLSSPLTISQIAGVASLSYRLSHYPTTSTTTTKETTIQHPTHLHDIALALSFLAKTYAVGSTYKYMGIAHSCGATLFTQYLSRIGLPNPPEPYTCPTALMLTAGIYSLPSLLAAHTPPLCSSAVAEIYAQIVSGAFGPLDPAAHSYEAASPAISGVYTDSALRAHGADALRWILLCQSRDDELVEREQGVEMETRLRSDGWVGGEGVESTQRVVDARYLVGKHDDVWESGHRMAKLIDEVVGKLLASPQMFFY